MGQGAEERSRAITPRLLCEHHVDLRCGSADNQVTRQPNADELAEGISFDMARANELSFFDKTAPWNTLKPKWKARLGTRSLTVSLSEQLSSFIREK